MKLSNRRQRALVVVAHPDDETIWMGGTILKLDKIDWTILCMSRAYDKDRAPKFKKVCKAMGVKGIIENMDDEGRLNHDGLVKQAKKIIQKNIKYEFDIIFTHGKNGEYGHENHIALYEAVVGLFRKEEIISKKIFTFHYRKKNYNTPFSKIISQKNTDLNMYLNKYIFEKKLLIMTGIYGFDPKGPDVGYCTNPESFKIIK